VYTTPVNKDQAKFRSTFTSSDEKSSSLLLFLI